MTQEDGYVLGRAIEDSVRCTEPFLKVKSTHVPEY